MRAPALEEFRFGFVVYLTKVCNLQCTYCSVFASPTADAWKLEPARFERWMESFAALGPRQMQVMLHGGEPLVANPPVELYSKILQHVARRNKVELAPTVVCSNGLLLTPQRARSLSRSGVTHLNVSIDGPAIMHDRSRLTALGQGSHAKVLERLEDLHHAGFEPGLIAVATQKGDVLAALDFFPLALIEIDPPSLIETDPLSL